MPINMKKAKRAIMWFRLDLRLHDNEALTAAIASAEEIIPIYVFDERHFMGRSPFGFRRTGSYRTKFIIEAVQDLRNSLQERGINLIVRVGKPEEEVFKLAQTTKASVYCNRERTYEEEQIQNVLEEKLWSIGQEIHFYRGKMLYYTQDLPFPIAHTPDIFTHFRKEVEKITPVRPPLPSPEAFTDWSIYIEPGEIPSLSDFEHDEPLWDKRAVMDFKGGESEGLARLQYYLWESDHIKNYKKTRNELLGESYSTKFSPWLAQGCLSPKMIYAEIKRYEKQRKKNQSTYWVYFELLWRDFFRLMGKKYGHKIFLEGGLKGYESKNLTEDEAKFNLWANAQTGQAFIDANMTELNRTGFMSNRGRQNVASYLINDLKVNWQMGAEYFESLLIDYDVTSNWVNWLYIAGVGNDPRDERYFNPASQSRRYDPQGEYIKLWLPQMRGYSGDDIHEANSSENPQEY